MYVYASEVITLIQVFLLKLLIQFSLHLCRDTKYTRVRGPLQYFVTIRKKDKKDFYKILTDKSQGERPLRKHRSWWEDNVGFWRNGCLYEYAEGNQLNQDKGTVREFMNKTNYP